MIEPSDLNGLYLLDALIYAVSFDSISQVATITLEVDPSFHDGLAKLLPEDDQAAMVDIVMSGVQAVNVERIPKRPSLWTADEKPHDWEVAQWRVVAAPFRSHQYVVTVKCWEGQRIRVTFAGVTVRASSREMGVVHEYVGT